MDAAWLGFATRSPCITRLDPTSCLSHQVTRILDVGHHLQLSIDTCVCIVWVNIYIPPLHEFWGLNSGYQETVPLLAEPSQ